jgi:NDP-sugar pyrophosphorylase family protein
VITQAFVLGAGLGTRLRPLTLHCPKPLIPVVNRPLIAWAFDHLIGAGVKRFVVNTHWRADVYAKAFPEPTYRGCPISFRHESPEVLETAGGLKNAEDLLGGEPFIVYNGDTLTTLPLDAALRVHRNAGNEVTLVLRSAGGPLQVALDESTGRIADIGRRVASAHEPRFLFTGVYIVEPAFLARIPAATKISVIPLFCDMIRAGERLGGVVIDDGDWFDLGSREKYLEVHAALAAREPRGPWIDPAARVAHARISGASAVGAGARVGEGAILEDCVLWPGAEVAAGSRLSRCIVIGGACADGEMTDRDVVPS